MRRYRTVIIIALMGIVPMVAAVFVMRFILPAAEPFQAPPPVQQAAAAPAPVVEEEPDEFMVLAAARALPVGTLLDEQHLTEVGVEEDSVRRWHIGTEDMDPDEMPYGHVVRQAISAGAPVTWPSLVGPRQRGFLAAVLKPGMRAITVRLGAGTRHSGLVDPGDRVDVVLTAQSRDRGEQNVLARTILEDVRVVAVDRRIGSAASAAEGGDEVERTEIVTATLEVLPSQTGLLALGELEGELSLAVRPLAAAGAPAEPADVVDMRSLLALPEENLQQKTVRVVRGSQVTDVSFGGGAQPVSIPASVPMKSKLAAESEPAPLRMLTADLPVPYVIPEEPVGRLATPPGKQGLAQVHDLASSTLVDTLPDENRRLTAPDVEGLPALSAVASDPGGELVQRLSGGIDLSGAVTGPAGVADVRNLPALPQEALQQKAVRIVRGSQATEVTFGGGAQPASLLEDATPEQGLAAAPEPESSRTLGTARPGPDGAGEARIDRREAPAGDPEAVPAANHVSSPAEGLREESRQRVALEVGGQRALPPTDPESGGALVQRLAGGGAAGALNSLGADGSAAGLTTVLLPDGASAEGTAEEGAGFELPLELTATPPVPDIDTPDPNLGGVSPGRERGRAVEEFDVSFLAEGMPEESGRQTAPAVGLTPSHRATSPDLEFPGMHAPGVGGTPAGTPNRVDAAAAKAIGRAVASLEDGAPVGNAPEAGFDLELAHALRADRSGPGAEVPEPAGNEAVSSQETQPEAAAEPATELAIESFTKGMFVQNGVAIAGGGALLLGWVGAFFWLRGQDRPLRGRLQSVAAPLTGRGAVEQVSPEESIFRPTRPKTRLSWLWRRMEERYPLIDAPRVFPRLLGIGALVAAGIWIGMWVLGVSGWWSMPAAVLAGLVGARYALGRIQARAENQFAQRFPEIVDQIVRLSAAGLPPLEALASVAEDAPQPVKGVLEEVSDALLAGLDADTALSMVAERVRLAEFTLFAAVIRLQRRAGGSITASFSNLSNTLRERRTSVLKAKSSTAQTRLTLLVLMLMPPLVLGVQSITSPESVDLLFNSENGQTLLQVGVGLIVVGLVVARQLAARGPK